MEHIRLYQIIEVDPNDFCDFVNEKDVSMCNNRFIYDLILLVCQIKLKTKEKNVDYLQYTSQILLYKCNM